MLRSIGKHFCAGHDLSGSDEALEKAAAGKGGPAKGSFVDWRERGLEAIYEWEAVHYLGYSRRWRDIPKPTIAEVQGSRCSTSTRPATATPSRWAATRFSPASPR